MSNIANKGMLAMVQLMGIITAHPRETKKEMYQRLSHNHKRYLEHFLPATQKKQWQKNPGRNAPCPCGSGFKAKLCPESHVGNYVYYFQEWSEEKKDVEDSPTRWIECKAWQIRESDDREALVQEIINIPGFVGFAEELIGAE